ncbi:MAG: hypothetical protein J6Y61_03935 [Bacteroidales bacterium]|nr:hypothetical protein [Bacteroidales bacterium]
MKKYFISLCLACVTLFSFAQNSALRQRLEIVELEINDGETQLEVLQMEDNGRYYLSVGHLGIGDDIIQFQVDPVFELFIPLGETLAESMVTLNQLKEHLKQPAGQTIEVQGCLSLAYPNDQWETVKVTTRQFLFTKMLEFSLERDGYIRAVHIRRSDFNGLVNSAGFYQKLHPNEK